MFCFRLGISPNKPAETEPPANHQGSETQRQLWGLWDGDSALGFKGLQNLFEDNEVSQWVKSLSRVRLFATPWTVAYQASPSMGFSRQEYRSRLSFPSPGDLPDPGIEPGLLHYRQILYYLTHQGGRLHTNHSTVSCNINLIIILWERDDNLLLLNGKCVLVQGYKLDLI